MRNGRSKNETPRNSPDADALAPPDLPGITLTPEPLSRGPQSAVYRGWDRIHHYSVVVKVLYPTADPVAADRFRREAAVMAQLRHPNIVALYQFHDGNPAALVMEYVPGQTLETLVKAKMYLEPAQAARIIEEVAAALDCIHAENIVHRDVKPSNILLPKHGPARLTDFGVARIEAAANLTVRGDLLGTIEYASPEQVKGTEVPDARSDVYSLAAAAYFALTGTPPFRAADSSMQSQLSVMHQQVFAQPPSLRLHRPDLAPGIDEAVTRGLAKDPAARYLSAGQFASTLRSATLAASGTPERAATAGANRRAGVLTGAFAGAACLIGGAILIWNHEQAAWVPVSVRPQSAAQIPKPMPFVPLKSGPKPAAVAAVPAPLAPAPLAPAAPVFPHRLSPVQTAAAVPEPVHVARRPTERLMAKRAVTERPKFRRHPALVAEARVSVPPFRAKPLPASGIAWLSVFARQSVGNASQEAAVPATSVMVDGHPISSLASGGWVALPSGKHLIAYVPAAGSGFGRNPGLWVTLAPGAHLSRQVLLPFETAGESHPVRTLVADSPPTLLRPAAPLQPAPVPSAAPLEAAAAPQAVGWYTVSGWIVRSAAAAKQTLVRTSAQWVKVDGQPILSLALGQWAQLSAGKHTVTFQPTDNVGAAAKTWDIDLPPLGHLDQHIPLPSSTPGPN